MGFFKGGDTGGGGKTMLFAGGSATVVGFVHAARQRRRLILIGSGIAAVIASITGVIVLKVVESRAAGRVVDGYSSLSKCLMGEALAEGEEASVRFRQIQLTAMTQVEQKRAADKAGPWPDRCAKYAHVLNEGLQSSSIGQNKGKGLLEASGALAETLDKKDGYWLNMSDAVDKTFDEAQTAGIVLQERADVPAPPERAQPLNLDTIAKEGVVTDKATAIGNVHWQAQTESAVRFVIDDAKIGPPTLCTVLADSAKCEVLPAAVAESGKGGVRLLASVDEGGQPLLFAGGGAGGIFRVNGDKIGSVDALGGWSAADGMSAVVSADGPNLKVLFANGKRTLTLPLVPGRYKLNDAKRDATLLWNHVVFMGVDGKEPALASAEVGARGVGMVEGIGPLSKAQLGERGASTDPRVDGCRAAGAVVGRAHAGRDDFVTFFLNGHWTPPVHAQTGGGVLTCTAAEAVLTKIEGGSGESATDAKITHQKCTPTECRSKAMPIRDALAGEVGLAPSTPMQAVGLEGKLLLVWLSGQRGGLRMRLGDAEGIEKLPDVILYDDLVSGGKVVDGTTVNDLKLLPAEHFAVLLVATPSGLRAFRITPDGKAAPVKM